MEIRSVEIRHLFAKSLKGDYNGVFHVKSLPCLSVVQPLNGRYKIRIGEQEPIIIEEGGAFVVPAGLKQEILHYNGADGWMQSHWVFMSITVNERYPFEDVFDLPLQISSAYREQLDQWINGVQNAPTLCARYAAAYQLADLLISLSTPKKEPFDPVSLRIKQYIDAHYREPITQERLAMVAACSVPNLYRIFAKNFGLSPRNYVNKVRLEKAAILLEIKNIPIAEIGAAVGFEDSVYFSRLFKESYHLSPKNYRDSFHSVK